MGRFQKMPDKKIVKKIFKGKSRGRRPSKKPRKRWLNDLRGMVVRNSLRVAKDRREWRCLLTEVRELRG